MMTISKDALIKLLGDRPVAYHPMLARALGGVIEAVFASQLLYWYDRGKLKDHWIWKTQAEWEEETGLTRSNQETARRNLKKQGLLKEKRKGVPGKIHFQLDLDRLADLLTMLDFNIVETPQCTMQEPDNVQCEDSANNNAETPQCIPESTPESTPREGEIPSRDYLTDVFNGNVNLREGEKLIQQADWDIRSLEHRQAIAVFLEASRLPIPPDEGRADWIKSINIHVRAYGVSQLEDLYPRVITKMCDDQLSISRPGSVTNPLAALVGEMSRHKEKSKVVPPPPGPLPDFVTS